MPKILNPDIYKIARLIANEKYSKPSAYKSMFLVKTYKELGGQYADDGTPKNLDRWKKEQWKDIAGLDYPVYRPTKKISKKTPLTVSEIKPSSLVKQSILKQYIKGSKNLPPFVKAKPTAYKKGGKRTAKEIKNFLDASYQDNPPENIDDFILDNQLSNDTVKVYYNPKSKEAVVIHRGTKGLTDWGNNLAYALGVYEYTQRYKKGKTIQDLAEAKYGKENISTLGHSQGSILSRKLGKDTKEIINVNPAYIFENPAKNEYNIRSSSDIVSGLFAPVAKTREILFPKYSKSRDITIPSKSSIDVVGEHSYSILERLGEKEIGQENKRQENKISNNDIMKDTRQFGLDEKIKQLVFLGIPQDAVALLLHTGNLEIVWNTWISGQNIKPILSQVLNSLEPQKSKKILFNLNPSNTDEDPLKEMSEPYNVADALAPESELVEGGMIVNRGTNPYGVRGGRRSILDLPNEVFRNIIENLNIASLVNLSQSLTSNQHPHSTTRRQMVNDRIDFIRSQSPPPENVIPTGATGRGIGRTFKKMGKSFKPISKALGNVNLTVNKNLAKVGTAVNPMTYALGNKDIRNTMIKSGEITHDYLLPAVVSAGKPIFDATAMVGSTMLTGNPVLGKAVADTVWNEMVTKKGADPRDNQKSKELGILSETFGQALSKPYSAALAGNGRGGKTSRWIDFVKLWAKNHDTTYGCALSQPECSKEYRAKYGTTKKVPRKMENEMMGMEDKDAAEVKKKQRKMDYRMKYAIVSKAKKAEMRRQGIPIPKEKSAIELEIEARKEREAMERTRMNVEDRNILSKPKKKGKKKSDLIIEDDEEDISTGNADEIANLIYSSMPKLLVIGKASSSEKKSIREDFERIKKIIESSLTSKKINKKEYNALKGKKMLGFLISKLEELN